MDWPAVVINCLYIIIIGSVAVVECLRNIILEKENEELRKRCLNDRFR